MSAKYFVNCRGVFQGGGCKAVAFIGAYRRALECGIGFSEFSGTSAGSIVASFAAAGATADEMEDFILNLDLSTLEQHKDDLKSISSWRLKRNYLRFNAWLLKKFGITISKELIDKAIVSLSFKGLYSSDFIRQQVDAFLRRKLGKHVDGDVIFAELKYPLKIVAADIQNKQIQVWDNRYENGNFSVAKAVQCSCTFPFVFRPVDDRYVDGGVLSNLPAIVFPEKAGDFERTIAFRLVEDEEEETNDLMRYVQKLVETVTEGASKLQMSERNKIQVIDVPTHIGLFDFDELYANSEKYTRSIQSGADAIDGFLQNELHKFIRTSDYPRASFTNAEQIYNQLVFLLTRKNNERIVFSTNTLRWVWALFVPLAYTVKKGITITVYAESNEADQVESARIRLLRHMGVDVYLASNTKLPAHGFFFYRKKRWYGVTYIQDGTSVHGTLLTTPVDSEIAESLVNSILAGEYIAQPKVGVATLNIEPVPNLNYLEKALKTRNVYQNNVRFTEEYIDLARLKFMNDNVHGYKYRTMSLLEELYGANELFVPAYIELANGKTSPMCPLLVDEIEGEYYLIEGHVRALYSYRNNRTTLKCLVSHGSRRHPSNQLYSIKDLHITDKNFEVGTIVGLRSHAQKNKSTRDIENALRPVKKFLKS